MVRFALLSGWHVHTGWFAGELLKSGAGKFVAVWDEDEARGKKYAEEFGAEFEPDLSKVLAREDVDAVMVECPTTKHRDVIIAAAKAGKHIFTDKSMALNMEDCAAIRQAVEEAGVKFTVSMESKILGPYRYLKQIIEEGKLGRVTSLYFRRSHKAAVDKNMLPAYWFDQTQTGGGVTLDLGCHGLYMLPYYCGKPKTITCRMEELYGTGGDELSTTIMEFENGAMGTAVTSFVSCYGVNMMEIVGTEGMAIISGNGPEDYRVLLQSTQMSGYEKLTPVEKDWQDAVYPIVRFAQLVESNEQEAPEYNLDQAELLTRVICCAYESARSGKPVTY